MSSQVVLITGATSGIGQETAELLASNGWKVIVSGRRSVEGQKADVSTEENVKALIEKSIAIWGHLDAALQHMSPRKYGRIVNLASVAGLHSIYKTGTYCVIKHTVVGLTKAAAIEYATSGVTINAITPGAIKTSVFKQALDSGIYTEEAIAALFPMKCMGVTADIAHGIKFLIDSLYATGSILAVDSGLGA
ncbi:short chain dehydrogenase [Penicillium lividum]|nr:short chain dehydrogenase [Penicillium lividum]